MTDPLNTGIFIRANVEGKWDSFDIGDPRLPDEAVRDWLQGLTVTQLQRTTDDSFGKSAMRTLTLDIETIPQERFHDELQELERQSRFPAHALDQFDPEVASKRAAAYERRVRSLSTDPWTCRLACVGLKSGTAATKVLGAWQPDQEAAVVEETLEACAAADRIITYGGRFDLRVILTRALVLGVPLPDRLSPKEVEFWFVKYRFMGRHFDCREAFNRWENPRYDEEHPIPHTLGDCAALLGLGGKTGGHTGADVWPLWLAGKFDEIARYCAGDVDLTLALFLKIRHQFGWAVAGDRAASLQ